MKKAMEKHFILTAIIYFIGLNKEIKGSESSNSIIEEDNVMLHVLNEFLENDMKKFRNITADPCDNFYEYSCGNYVGYANSDDKVREITQYLEHKFNRKLLGLMEPKRILSNLHTEARRQTWREKTQNYYEACVREDSKNFVKYFEELQIKWPFLPAEYKIYWGLGTNQFWQLLGKLQGYNWNNLIIKHQITVNEDDTLNIILEAAHYSEQPSLPENVALESILRALKVANASEIVQQIKTTQQMWWEIFQNNSRSEIINSEISLMDLTVQYPFLRAYLRKLLNQKIHKIEKILLKNVAFFKHLQEIQWTSDELPLQVNYLMLHFIFYLFEDSSRKFTPNACLTDLRNKLDMAVNYIYYEQIYSKDHWLYEDGFRRINSQLENIIQEVFEENNLNLTLQQLQDLRDKLHRIQVNLGNLPYPVLSETIEKFYEDVPDLDSRNYFKNHLLLLQHRFRKSLLYQEQLNYFITPDNSMGSCSAMFYVHRQHLLIVPFASLQYPFYHYSFKPLYQVSLMGFIMAHEMAHALDKNELITTGHDGIVEHNLYKKSLECLQKQKSTEHIEERIADLFAERVAYRTYETFYNAVNSTTWQRPFYLSMAQFFCNKGSLRFPEHDHSDVRLNQIVMNSKGFAQAFNCSRDSAMNPQRKCRLF